MRLLLCPPALANRAARIESLVAALEAAEARPRDEPPSTDEQTWLVGRASEVEAFATDVFLDVGRRRLPIVEAGHIIDAYLGRITAGLRRYLPDANTEESRETPRWPWPPSRPFGAATRDAFGVGASR